ncbi:enoyl-CoA hydratase-related protein [Humibacter sp.]|uniref:enoyl-CoA hydratase-related protein n=1 Tax=Humibacter sp. TaxID=1940291 RepID=UPI002C6D397B|nr:enoyl-CoA hydratase-related protein [Humibacter sp.]HVX09171.1 enoyl-CoA hydratase-related protein [Humibacter sp.]
MPRELVVRTVSDHGVGELRLNDPDRRNVLSFEMSEAIGTAVAEVLAAGAKAVVLTAAPPVFCSGGSLEGLISRARPLRDTYRGYRALFECPVPTLALVEGAAVGAGVNLALACDVVVAGDKARFDPRFLDVGIHPGGGHLRRLLERTGAQGAAALCLFGEALTGDEAVRAGLAWRCFEGDEARRSAFALADRAAGRDADLVRRAKDSLRLSRWVADDDAAFDLELAAQEWSVERPEFVVAVQRIRDALAARAR